MNRERNGLRRRPFGFRGSALAFLRKRNICEYKNRYDTLNERVVRKGCGYANLYIGTAGHEGDIPSGQVTLSIFRAAKPEKLFLTQKSNH